MPGDCVIIDDVVVVSFDGRRSWFVVSVCLHSSQKGSCTAALSRKRAGSDAFSSCVFFDEIRR